MGLFCERHSDIDPDRSRIDLTAQKYSFNLPSFFVLFRVTLVLYVVLKETTAFEYDLRSLDCQSKLVTIRDELRIRGPVKGAQERPPHNGGLVREPTD